METQSLNAHWCALEDIDALGDVLLPVPYTLFFLFFFTKRIRGILGPSARNFIPICTRWSLSAMPMEGNLSYWMNDGSAREGYHCTAKETVPADRNQYVFRVCDFALLVG